MKADYSRLYFRLDKQYTRILLQQGRTLLDADWNEDKERQAHLDRQRLIDIIGACGVPENNPGFQVVPVADGSDLDILPGVIYIEGLRVEIRDPVSYNTQPYWPDPPPLSGIPEAGDPRVDLVYICASERHITYLEDDDIREVALGGPDTTTRVETIWKVHTVEDVALASCDDDASDLLPSPVGGGLLTVDVTPPAVDEDPCVTPANSGYRGLENRLYRVEVHEGGTIDRASVKWSRYNGAVVFNVVPDTINEVLRTLRLTRLGWDQIRTLKKNDWIEIISEADELNGVPGVLVQIDDGDNAIDEAQREITIKDEPTFTAALMTYKTQANVKVRLWDSEAQGAIALADVLDTTTATTPIELEDGIQIELSVADASDQFRTGDYWTFTARAITGTIDLLTDEPPHGPTWHCCKLALIHWASDRDEAALVIPNDTSFDPNIILEWGFDTDENVWVFRVDTDRTDINALVDVLIESFARGEAPTNLYNGLGLDSADADERRTFAEDFFVFRDDEIVARFETRDAEFRRIMLRWFAGIEGIFVEDCRSIFPPLTEIANLYYVSGDGQEAMPGNQLPQPLIVRVNRGEHPVAGVPVVFALADPGNDGQIFAGTESGDTLTIYTDEDGFAQVDWVLGDDRRIWSQQVIAFIDAPDHARDHLQVRFNANLSIAEQVSYQPPDDCRNLAETSTVAEALDALCDISTQEDPGFHVIGAFWLKESEGKLTIGDVVEVAIDAANDALIMRLNEVGERNNIKLRTLVARLKSAVPTAKFTLSGDQIVITTGRQTGINVIPRKRSEIVRMPPLLNRFRPTANSFELPAEIAAIPIEVGELSDERPARNDEEVEMDVFVRGLRIDCDAKPEPDSIKHATCYMQLELPYGRTALPFLNMEFTIPGNVIAHQNHIIWRPNKVTAAWLMRELSEMLNGQATVLARFTIKGNFIWQIDDPDIYLDGEATGTADGATPHNLNLPSGDGKSGGDFQMWFNVQTPEIDEPDESGIFVAGVLHPNTLIGLETVNVQSDGSIVVLSDSNINRRLDALNEAYDHQTAVDRSGLNYTPDDIVFDDVRAINLMGNSGIGSLDSFDVRVLIQAEIAKLGPPIVEPWNGTFAALSNIELKFNLETIPASDLVNHVKAALKEGNPHHLVICGDGVLSKLADDPEIGMHFQAPFWRRV